MHCCLLSGLYSIVFVVAPGFEAANLPAVILIYHPAWKKDWSRSLPPNVGADKGPPKLTPTASMLLVDSNVASAPGN